MSKPLDGVRVLEAANFVFAPAAAAILGEWGAEVIKVEPLTGDPARMVSAWGVPALVDGVAHLFEMVNRDKCSISIQLAEPEGRELFLRLVDTADVFITNFLPVTRRKLGIEPSDLLDRNPRLIYARASAHGNEGDEAELGGFDGTTYWGRTGAAISVTPPDAPYPLAMPGPGFGDLQAAMALAGGIGTALFERDRTGKGTVVDVSLLGAGLWAMGISLSGVSVAQRDTLDYQYHDAANNPLANTYRTRDGRFVNLAFLQSDRYWPEFCVAVDHPEWLADERFADSDARRANAKACIKLLDDLFATRPLEEWKQVLARQPGQWDVIYTPGEALAHPQVLANRYTQSVRHSGDTSVVLTSSPVRFGEESPTLGRAPTLGRDTDEALASCGVDRAEISRLRDAGIVG